MCSASPLSGRTGIKVWMLSIQEVDNAPLPSSKWKQLAELHGPISELQVPPRMGRPMFEHAVPYCVRFI